MGAQQGKAAASYEGSEIAASQGLLARRIIDPSVMIPLNDGYGSLSHFILAPRESFGVGCHDRGHHLVNHIV